MDVDGCSEMLAQSKTVLGGVMRETGSGIGAATEGTGVEKTATGDVAT